MQKKPLVLFGTHKFAELVRYYFDHDSSYEVIGFTVDSQYQQCDFLGGLPVVPFERVEQYYSASETAMFIAIGYSGLNWLRAQKCAEAHSRGYHLATYISRRASVWPDLVIGENCFIMEQAIIQPFAQMGEGVIVCTGANISHDCRLADYNFVAAHAVLGGHVEIGNRCFIGMNAIVKDHMKLADECLIGAGAYVSEDAPPSSVYVAEGTKRAAFSSRLAKNFL